MRFAKERGERWKWVLLAMGTAAILWGCANPLYQPNRTRYTYQLRMVAPVQSKSQYYEDDNIAISFNFFETEIAFRIRNKTDRLLTILWDDSRYVSETGVAKPMFHKGIRVGKRFDPQPPTVMPARTVLDDHVVPVENVVQGLVRSTYIPILPVWDYENDFYIQGANETADRAAERRRAIASGLDGRTIGIDLALKIDEDPKTYSFRFLVKVSREAG